MAKRVVSQRTTISVPAALKARMGKVKEAINWSALACEAFERKLAEISTKKEKKSMDDVIARLRASKVRSESIDFSSGFSDGQAWAKGAAEATTLDRLDRFYQRLSADQHCDWQWFFMNGEEGSVYTLAEQVHAEIAGLPSPDRNDAYDFFTVYFESTESTSEWTGEMLRGFCQGALEIWWQVREQL